MSASDPQKNASPLAARNFESDFDTAMVDRLYEAGTDQPYDAHYGFFSAYLLVDVTPMMTTITEPVLTV